MVSKNASNNLQDDNFDSVNPVGPEKKQDDSVKNSFTNANIDSTVGADGNDEQFVITDDDLVDPEDLKDHELPGYPAVLDGSRFEALKNDIAQHGQQEPLLVGLNSRIVYSGRSRRKACAELGLQVRVTYIPDAKGPDAAWASAVQREWTLAERARYVHYLWNNEHVWKNQMGWKTGDKSRECIGRWLKKFRGWSTDISGRQIANFNDLAIKLIEKPEAEAALIDMNSVAGALRKLSQKPRKTRTPDPIKLVHSLVTRLETAARDAMSNLNHDDRNQLACKLEKLIEDLRN